MLVENGGVIRFKKLCTKEICLGVIRLNNDLCCWFHFFFCFLVYFVMWYFCNYYYEYFLKCSTIYYIFVMIYYSLFIYLFFCWINQWGCMVCSLLTLTAHRLLLLTNETQVETKWLIHKMKNSTPSNIPFRYKHILKKTVIVCFIELEFASSAPTPPLLW